jgi:hypothetical protein
MTRATLTPIPVPSNLDSDYITGPVSPDKMDSRHLRDPHPGDIAHSPRRYKSKEERSEMPPPPILPQDQSTPNSKIWCHTAGRVSCLARVPFYSISCLFQIPKMALKLTFSALEFLVSFFPVTIYNIYARCMDRPTIQYFKGRVAENWSFKGLARDGIATLNLAQRTANSIWLTIVAPPSHYRSFTEAVQAATEAAEGKYHQLNGQPSNVSAVWKLFVIPNYFRQISSCCRNSLDSLPELNG